MLSTAEADIPPPGPYGPSWPMTTGWLTPIGTVAKLPVIVPSEASDRLAWVSGRKALLSLASWAKAVVVSRTSAQALVVSIALIWIFSVVEANLPVALG